MEIKGYIFDIDGTLLSSVQAHLVAWKRALREYGMMPTEDEIVSHFSKPTPVICQNLAPNADHKTIMEIANQKTIYFIDEVERIKLFPKVEELLSEIHKNGIPICFASSNFNRVIQKIVKTFHWDELSVGYVGIDNLVKSKPDPEMIFQSLKLLQSDPSETVMIGDSTYDIMAGKAANTKTIGVCTTHPKKEIESCNPDMVLNEVGDLFDLLPLRIE
jgi:HAD superfamily hydrolase (TIGR01509 family)